MECDPRLLPCSLFRGLFCCCLGGRLFGCWFLRCGFLFRIKEGGPAEFGLDRFLSFADREFCDGVDDPVEAFFADGMQVGIRRRIHEVDSVRDAVFTGELDGVKVVPESFAEGERILFNAL